VTVADVTPERTVFYLHGGGLRIGSAMGYRDWAARLARAARARVLVVEYPLCPEASITEILESCVGAYLDSRDRFPDQPFSVAGDSAGGGLALSLVIALRDRGLSLPVATLACSPITLRDGFLPSFDRNRDTDPFVDKQGSANARPLVLGDLDPRSSLASPLCADLAGLPPTQLQVSSAELLLDDSLEYAAKLARAGGTVELHAIADVVHVWPLFAAVFPEGQASIERAAAFLFGVEK
jgi:acetyl esterase/lipase